MKYLLLDFETKDPYIGLGLGAGYPFALNVSTHLFKVLGYSYAIMEQDIISEPSYHVINEDTVNQLRLLLSNTDVVVMHNAPYDLGCLMVLGIDITPLQVIDTKIVAKLYDNTLMSYSLEPLSEKYLHVDSRKNKGILVDFIKQSGISGINPDTLTAKTRMLKWAYENMDIIQNTDLKVMADYANQDITATGELLKYYQSKMKNYTDKMIYWSHFQIYLTQMRAKGQRIDMEVVNKAIELMRPRADVLKEEITKVISDKLNARNVDLTSPKQLGEALKDLGYKLKLTPTGIPQTDKDSLSKYNTDELVSKIIKWKEIDKICRDFFEKTKEMQQYTCPEALEPDAKYGRIFPELTLFGASATGRFSASCPNVQQMPSRSEEFSDLCRAMFIPNEDGNQWISGDYSNQEGRLQIHYAYGIKAKDADKIVDAFKENPLLDLHQKIAHLTGLQRNEAKAINLGLAYGMGSAKLSKALGFGTTWISTQHGKKIEVADENGMFILKKYNEGAPYIKELSDACMKKIKFANYIKTINGRVLRREDSKWDYKALNKLIQGSAADQTLIAFDLCMKAGLKVLNLVHDEINIEGTLEDAKKLQELMEKAVILSLPVVANIEVGSSWGTVEEIKHEMVSTDIPNTSRG